MLGAAGASSFVPWLGARSALAQSEEVPLRILFVILNHGTLTGNWEPVSANPTPGFNADTRVETDWALNPFFADLLQPYRSRMTMFQNMDMVSEREDPTGASNAHIAGRTHQLTAARRQTSSLSSGVSIDQFIAQRLNANGPLTRLPSLEVTAQEWGRSDNDTASFSAPGNSVPYLVRPTEVWDRIFPTPLSADGQNLEALRAAAAFDRLHRDYQRLIGRLGAEDRAKIEAQLALRTDLQARIAVTTDRELNRPPASVLDPYHALDDGYQRGSTDNRMWNTIVDVNMRLVAAALHTDTARVVAFKINQAPNYEFGFVNGEHGASDWHDLDHKVSGDNPELTDPVARGKIETMQWLNYRKLRDLLDLLASLPETDGSSLLDHTLVVVTSHISNGSHDLTRLPWMTFGDAHGRLRMGRYIRFGLGCQEGRERACSSGDPDAGGDRIYNLRGRPHNDYFTSLARAMGLSDVSNFGEESVGTGPITEWLV